MRLFTQTGVVTTHSLLFFAPAVSVFYGASLLVTHVTRFAFMFLSVAVLVYMTPALKREDLGAFWRRRFVTVALPYCTWTLVYFLLESLHIKGVPVAFERTGGIVSSLPTSLEHLGFLLVAGYYQLYFLVLLLEFYLLYPAFLWLLRRTERHHAALVGASFVLQLVITSLGHWGVTPAWMQGAAEARELWNYQLYLVAGGVMAWHYEQVDAWLRSHSRQIVASTVVALALAEGFYLAAHLNWVTGLGGVSPSDPFQPMTVPLILCLIADIYLLGVMATDRRRSARFRARVRSAADNCYGVYLSQVIFIAFLVALRWKYLETLVPWPLVVVGAVVIVFSSASVLTAVLARFPGAQATAGRRGVRPRMSRVTST